MTEAARLQKQVFLRHPDEVPGAAIGLRPIPRGYDGGGEAFGLADEGRRACDAEAAALGLEVVARVLGAVIVAKGKAGGDVLADGAEALAHALPDRLERLEATGAAAGLEADAFGRALGRLWPTVPTGTRSSALPMMIDRDDGGVTVSAARA